ncbi:uncharacterized protein LOC5509827 isoform X2 [Nematostella vectensis]|uniref:uncharacterized protein LOC5509827 isoform X2 n=1 Tax=Nematostella vectensis TaxID=45351 RepID=UPI0013900850|nr:uncharacterized protein LOC5509827 isoform X2 [Nematostella vectensis]
MGLSCRLHIRNIEHSGYAKEKSQKNTNRVKMGCFSRMAQYNEEGQTFKSFLSTCPWLSTKKKHLIKEDFHPEGNCIKDRYPEGKIYILPLGDFDRMSPDIHVLARYAQLFYDLPVVVLPKVDLKIPEEKDGPVMWCESASEPSDGEDKPRSKRRKSSRIASNMHILDHRWNTGRIQLKVDGILKLLSRHRPPNTLCLIALTMSDLYEEEPDLFVAGMASGNKGVAVFSFARYDPVITFSTEFWYEIEKTFNFKEEERTSLMLQRSCKLLVHEIAHLFGIDHCIWYACCMNGSGHLGEDFSQPIHLCPVDLHKVQKLCGFDVVLRYKGLLRFFREHRMEKEAEWVSRRLDYITG